MTTTFSPEIEGLIKRILTFKSPFDILDVTNDTSIPEIQKKYKKLALSIHPDKCKHTRAVEAFFEALKKAASDLENDEQREYYTKIREKAEAQVLEEWIIKEKKPSENESEFRYEVKKISHKLILEVKHNIQRADDMRLANERMEKEKKIKIDEERKKDEEEQKKWEEGRNERVQSWREWSSKAPNRKRVASESSLNEMLPPSQQKKIKYTPKAIKPPKVKLNNS